MSSDTDGAFLVLARLREKYMHDEEGRALAAKQLVIDFYETAEKVGFTIGTEDHLRFVSIAPWAKIVVRAAGGEVFVDEEKFEHGIDYHPVARAFVATDREGPGPVTLLASFIGERLDEKTAAQAPRAAPASS